MQSRFQSNIPSIRWYIARIFQICSAQAGYEELAGGLEPIRNGEIFWMNNMKINQYYYIHIDLNCLWLFEWNACKLAKAA